MLIYLKNAVSLAAICLLVGSVYGQNRFEGYSFLNLEADVGGSCPVRYLPATENRNSVQVYLAGTDQRTPATGLTSCNQSTVREGNRIAPNPEGQWCFQGKEEFYDIRLSTGVTYLWYPINKHAGFYNVKDFRPVKRTSGATPQYAFTEPTDYTKTIRNAMAFIASRQGGTLRFPDGDYVVGTLDGNRRDPSYEAITLPSGIIVEGASWNYSVPTTNLPIRTSASRIRLRNDNQAIFRIGGCTNHVRVRNIELLGNSGLYGEAARSAANTYGIEGMGKWEIDPRTGGQRVNQSLGLKIENVTFQNFDKGLYVHNANDDKCNSREQNCYSWQIDYAVVDHGMFINNKTGIWVESFNTDWKITNSFLGYIATNPPGDGIRLKIAGNVLIEQTFGGGYDYASAIGGTFLTIDAAVTVTIIASSSERGKRSIYTNPLGGVSSAMINVAGSVFGDKVDLNGRLNYVSTGNFYQANTIEADPGVVITSVGDRYCYDPLVLPGRCVDDAGRTTAKPAIAGGRRMFETGQMGEDAGPNRIEGKPNYFGYNVRIGDGLLQFDPNITFKDITDWAAGVGTRPRAEDGALVYCKDCRRSNNGLCTQGTAGTDGAFAKRINGQWRCD